MATKPKTTPAAALSQVDEINLALAVIGETPPAEHTPTPEEAAAMFAENPGLWSVVTTEGTKLRGEC